jgi:hypothetical protein
MISHCLTDCEPLTNRVSGGVSRAAKGADCKSAGLRLRRFESYLPHQLENKRENLVSATSKVAVFMSRMLQDFPL